MYIGWYCVDCRAKPFEVRRHPGVIDALGKLVRSPFLFTIKCGKVECMNGMAVERGLFILDHGIMTINPYRSVVMRDGKSQDLPMKLFLAPHEPYTGPRLLEPKSHTVRILSIRHFEHSRTDFA